MKKKLLGLILVAAMVVALAGCSKIAEETQTAVDAYNAELATYNESASPYNDAVDSMVSANEELDASLDSAQEALNKNETPFDEETVTALKDAMSTAQDAKVVAPEKMQEFDELTVNSEAKSDELKALKEQAEADMATMQGIEIPETPEIPDYSEVIAGVSKAQEAYEDSIQSLKQITAPADDFVMERLQRVDTITAMAAVTEDHDPNEKLGKQGGYIGCIYWSDNQVDKSKIYEYSNDVIEVGTEGGGAIEIYNTVEEATARDTYLASFDGSGFASGSHYVYGTIIIRTSDHLSGTKQQELTQKVLEALIAVDK